MEPTFPRPLAVLLLAVAAPLFARGTEGMFGLAPCELCLWQRWPYWVAAGCALLALPLARGGVWRTRMVTLAGVAVLASAAVGMLHFGVEQGWWPSPLPGCRAPNAGAGLSVEDMLRSLTPRPNKPCDAPTYLLQGLPLSMAGMNIIYALGVAAFTLTSARRRA